MRQDQIVWRDFLSSQTTLATPQRNYPDWHQGRSRFCVWGILLTQDDVINELAHARQWLNPFLVQPYPRQAHITLSPCGFWRPEPACINSAQQDNYSEEILIDQLDRLNQLKLTSFTLRIGALNSFSSAAYLEVSDVEGNLALLRTCLPGFFEEIRTIDYTPHVTVGCYRDTFSVADVAEYIERYSPLLPPTLAPIVIHVREIALLSYATDDIGSPLSVERRHYLAD